MTTHKIVPMINAFMVNVSNIQTTIQTTSVSVNVTKDGLDDTVQFNIVVLVHLIHYALVFLLIIDLYVFVLRINLVYDVFLLIQYVRLTLTQHVDKMVNALQMMIIWYPKKTLPVSVEKDLAEIDVN
jgi:hypothetical protein